MTTTAAKYASLNASDISSTSKQLIYPTDLLSNTTDYPGHVVVFEPNYIKGHSVDIVQPLSTPSNTISGAYGSEVAMQQAGTNTIRSSSSGSSASSTYTKSDERIILPMPLSVGIQYAANWSTTELGSIGRGLAFLNSIGTSDVDKKIMREQLGDAAARTLAGAAQQIGVGNALDYLEISSGYVANGYVEVLFRGMQNRTIPFSWVVQPRNLAEAQMIKSVINRFKYHMAPEFKYTEGNNSYLLSPSTFDITYLDLSSIEGTTSTTNTWLWKMSTCALTGLSVNGTAGGNYAILKDGAPASVALDLQFTEMVTLTKADFNDQDDAY